MSVQPKLLAKALYDNIAETPDEIAFRRGDVLGVLEQDTGGLEGWWLCSLRGKQGIAPGNRLKVLSGMKNEVFNKEESPTPPDRRSWDVSPNKVVTPHKIGGVYMFNQGERPMADYDVPPSQFPHDVNKSLDDQPNYDTPQSARNDSTFNSSNRSEAGLMNLSSLNQSLYDTPPTNKSQHLTLPENMYDVPPSSLSSPGGDVYDIPQPSSNRSSILSSLSHLSNESTMTYSSGSFSNKSNSHHSNPPSMCDSARSSMDISPQDLYDVPPSAMESRGFNHNKQPSADSGLDLYDSPPKVKVTSDVLDQQDYDVPRTDLDYDTPKPVSLSNSATLTPKPKKTEQSSITPDKLNVSRTETSSNNVYDLTDGSKTSLEHDIDDVYDVPQSNAPVRNKVIMPKKGESDKNFSLLSDISEKSKFDPSGVYDIPPQVTRDSMLSSKSDSSDGADDKRLSTCSIDSRNDDIPIYDELPLDLDAAMDLMIKLQQDVQRSTTKMASFVSSIWRTKQNLESNLYGIKLACNSVKTSLDEFLDFAQGTLANSARLPDRKLINKLHKQLSPLQQTLLQIKICMKNLDESNWQVTKLVTDDAAKNDDLGKIALACKDLPQEVRRLVSSIHGNSSLLFRRASDVVLNVSDSKGNTDSSPIGSKPPIKSKPQLPPKPQVASKPGSLQHRPLPPPPLKERPLPPTPTDKKTNPFEEGKRISGDFTRNSDDFKRYSAEFRQISLDFKAQIKQSESLNGNKDIVEEYDYVHLEAKDSDNHIKHKEIDETPVKDTDQSVQSTEGDSVKVNTDGLKTPVNVRAGHVFNDAYMLAATVLLDSNDKQVLYYYSGQLETHSTLLNNAIDAFFSCIECGQGPKVFISHSKFVVVSAHKLVYVGDSLYKNLTNNEVRNKIMQCANHLCNCLKATVTTTKTAALQYPSVPAVQEMVDRVVDVSHAAFELKLVITQSSGL